MSNLELRSGWPRGRRIASASLRRQLQPPSGQVGRGNMQPDVVAAVSLLALAPGGSVQADYVCIGLEPRGDLYHSPRCQR